MNLIRRQFPLLFIFIIACILLFWRLGVNTLANWDEAWYADASRFMFRNDHFLTPIWNNQYFFDKPPLQYWVTQPFLWIFGERELAYRLPSAIASVVLTLLVYQWGKTRNEISGGLVAALVLLSFPHFLDRSRSGNFDALFTMWTTLSLWLFVRATYRIAGGASGSSTLRVSDSNEDLAERPQRVFERGRRAGRSEATGPAIAGGIALGLAWLTKGVFPGLFPIVVIALFLVYERIRFRSFRLFLPTIYYLLSTIFVYAPWHFLEVTRFDHLINSSYFASLDQGTFGSWNWMDIVDRFNLRYLVFLWTFLRWWFPVALLAIGWSLLRLNRTLFSAPDNEKSSRAFVSFLPLLSLLTMFLALSASREKNDWYLMPTYPFIALIIGDFLHHIFQQKKFFLIIVALSVSISNLWSHRKQAFPPNTHLVEKEVAQFVNVHTIADDLIVTAEYEFPTLRYYSERETRTAASQPDFQGKYWWIWDNVDIETALRRGREIVVITRPGTEWPVDVWGYHREKIGEVNGRTISRMVVN